MCVVSKAGPTSIAGSRELTFNSAPLQDMH